MRRCSPEGRLVQGGFSGFSCDILENVSEPLVSVVLPTHNRPEWLAESVGSVVGGEFDDFELIVSNNGCPDHSRELAKQVQDSRVIWLEQDQSLNMLENVIEPLSRARGRFVAVLHDDDTWSSAFLTSLVPPLLAREDAVLSFCDHFVVDRSGAIDHSATEWHSRRWGRAGLAPGYHQPFFELAARQTVPITGCVFRRSALPLNGLTPDIGSFYDIWFAYLLACSGGAAYYDRRRLLNYRMHGSSGQASMDIADHEAALRGRGRMVEDPQMRPYLGVLRERLARDHLSIGAALLRAGARSSAREHLRAAVQLSPNWKAFGGIAASWVAPKSVLTRI